MCALVCRRLCVAATTTSSSSSTGAARFAPSPLLPAPSPAPSPPQPPRSSCRCSAWLCVLLLLLLMHALRPWPSQAVGCCCGRPALAAGVAGDKWQIQKWFSPQFQHSLELSLFCMCGPVDRGMYDYTTHERLTLRLWSVLLRDLCRIHSIFDTSTKLYSPQSMPKFSIKST
jgi:hypothetical protein